MQKLARLRIGWNLLINGEKTNMIGSICCRGTIFISPLTATCVGMANEKRFFVASHGEVKVFCKTSVFYREARNTNISSCWYFVISNHLCQTVFKQYWLDVSYFSFHYKGQRPVIFVRWVMNGFIFYFDERFVMTVKYESEIRRHWFKRFSLPSFLNLN